MNANLPPLFEYQTDEAFENTINRSRSHARPTAYGFANLTTNGKCGGACRAWPTACGLIYVVDTFPGLADLAKMILQGEGFSTCTFEDRAAAWQAFAFADPRPALLITDNLDGDAAAMELITRCRSVEPKLKTLLIDHRLTISRRPTEWVDGLLSRPYCASVLIQEVRRLCTHRLAAPQPNSSPIDKFW